jgi:hypothetical protein
MITLWRYVLLLFFGKRKSNSRSFTRAYADIVQEREDGEIVELSDYRKNQHGKARA